MRKVLTVFLVLASLLFAFTMTSCDKEEGKVYYLNFKPEQNEDWQKLAKKYTEETGIEVKVVTAAAGTYETTLTAELDKELLDESITYYKLKNASKWEVDDDDFIDSSKKEVTTYTHIFT